MSERKVLNKYYPPDFDPSKIPKLKQSRNKQYTIRTMAPFNMRCNTCADYIYKGRKFNAKCEVAEGENFLGLRIYRFYIRCPKCITEIMFKTDPENTDYTLESGATRLFEAAKLIEEAERREQRQREEDATNPMKMLETRTKDSRLEMDIIENLEDLREINTRKEEVDYKEILRRQAEEEQEQLQRQEKEDEDEIRRIFGKTGEGSLKRIQDDDVDSDEEEESPSLRKYVKASDVLVEGSETKKNSQKSSRAQISSLIKRKKTVLTEATSSSTSSCDSVSTIKEETRINETSKPSQSSNINNVPPVQASTSTDRLSQENENKDIEGDKSNKEPSEESSQHQEEESELRCLDDSIREGMSKIKENMKKKEERKAPSFGMLVGYEASGSDISSESE